MELPRKPPVLPFAPGKPFSWKFFFQTCPNFKSDTSDGQTWSKMFRLLVTQRHFTSGHSLLE
jgi:hypothetical protein